MIVMKKILVPVDFSDFSARAVKYGCELARRFDAEIHLLNIVEDFAPATFEGIALMDWQAQYATGMQEAARRELEKMPESGDGLRVIRHVKLGTPFLEIVKYARENDVDLIVQGTHGRTGLAHLLMGSVAENIVRQAPCPVLTVRLEGHDFIKP